MMKLPKKTRHQGAFSILSDPDISIQPLFQES